MEATTALVKPAVRFSEAEQYISLPAQWHSSNFRTLPQIMYKWYLVKVLPSHLEILESLSA